MDYHLPIIILEGNMTIKKKIKIWKNNYVYKQVERIILPDFNQSEIERLEVEFSGRVQKVGFRLEIYLLAKKLGLTGFAENLPNGKVLMEVQGEREKIDFLLEFMKGLIRAKVEKVIIKKMDKISREDSFIITE